MKMKHLLASAPTLEGIEECITRFFCGESKRLVERIPGKEWDLTRTAGTVIAGLQVRKAGNRYRFEME